MSIAKPLTTIHGDRLGLGTDDELIKADGVGTAVAVAGAATLHKQTGKVTTESLNTAAGALYTLTLTNRVAAAGDAVIASFGDGTNTTPGAAIEEIAPGAGSIVFRVRNNGAGALNGTLVIQYHIIKA